MKTDTLKIHFFTKLTCKRMLRNRSWALLMLKARSRLEQISRLWSFFTLFTNPSKPPRGRFFATTRRPEHGLGLAVILLPSISNPTSIQTVTTNQNPKNSYTDAKPTHRYRNIYRIMLQTESIVGLCFSFYVEKPQISRPRKKLGVYSPKARRLISQSHWVVEISVYAVIQASI